MKHAPIRTVTCKCDVCNEEKDFSYDKDTHNYDSESGMVVCSECHNEFEIAYKVWGTPVIWGAVPEVRVNYNEEEYEPDYED